MTTGQRVLVTGAGGFIGARVVARLAGEAGVRVAAGVRDTRRAAARLVADVELREVDWLDRGALGAAVRGCDVVVNTAHDFRASEQANVRGFANLLDACCAAGVRRLVHTSSVVVYDGWPEQDLREDSPRGAPGGAYKNAKLAMERLLAERASRGEIEGAVLQPTIVYGPGGWMWTDRIVEQLATGTLLLPSRCDGCCNAVYVDDVAEALALAAIRPLDRFETLIVSGPEPVTWRAFFEAYAAMVGGDCLRFETGGAAGPGATAAGASGARGGVLADAMRLANTAPVRRVIGLARRVVGETAIERVRRVLLEMRRRRGPIVYRATPEERVLFAAAGRCRVERAHDVLGFAPAVDFAEGARRTASHVSAKLARHAAPSSG